MVATAIDGDLDKADKAFDLGGRIAFGDDVPVVELKDTVEAQQGFTVEYKGGEAAYNNSFGYYVKDSNGNPSSGVLVWSNVKDFTAGTAVILPEGVTADQIGFFIIPNGNDVNPGLTENTPVTFALVEGSWTVFANGEALSGVDAPAFFSDQALNLDSQSHLQQAPAGTEAGETAEGNFNWEDLVITATSSDKDYDDVNMNLNWNVPILVKDVVADAGTSVDTDTGALTGRFVFNFGADGELASGGKLFGLEVVSSISGLRDTATGQFVTVVATGSAGNSVQGYVVVNSVNVPVFSISVDAAGVVTVEQYRAVIHPTNDPSEIISIGDGIVNLTAQATDGDKDVDVNRYDIGRQINFQDVGPVAAEDAINLTAVQGVSTGSTNSPTFNVLTNDAHEAKADGALAGVEWVRAGGDRTYNVTDFTPSYEAEGVVGNLTVNDAGDAVYSLDNLRALALGEGEKLEDVFSYQMSDADKDTDVAKVTVEVTGVNDAPEFVTTIEGEQDPIQEIWIDKNSDGIKDEGETSLYSAPTDDVVQLGVHEDALATGNQESTSQTTTDDDSFEVVDPDIGDEPIARFDTNVPLPTLFSNGLAVVWAPNSDATEMIGTVGSDEIIRVSIAGSYANGYTTNVLLSGSVDHLPPASGSTDGDSNSLEFAVIANDRPLNPATGLSDTMTLRVSIEDDAPTMVLSDDGVTPSSQNIVIANYAGLSAVANTGVLSMGADSIDANQSFISQAQFDNLPPTVVPTLVTGVASNGTVFNVTSGGSNLVFVNVGSSLVAFVEDAVTPNVPPANMDGAVLSVVLSSDATQYTLTMLDTVDPYTIVQTGPVQTLDTSFGTTPSTKGEVATQTVVTQVVITTSAMDFTIPLTLTATDGDGDVVSSDFHVTIDANNDRIMDALSTGEARVVISEQVKTTTTVSLVDPNDANSLPQNEPLAQGPIVSEVVDEPIVYDSNGVSLDGTPIDSIDDVSTQAVLDALPGNYTDDDVIRGSETDDHSLSGGKGDDVLIGGKGSDTFSGGEGDDVIQINLADSSADGTDVDVVTDLAGGDRIVVSDLLGDDNGDLTALLPTATPDGSSVALDSNGSAPGGVTQEVVVLNITPDVLTVDSILTTSPATIEIKPPQGD